MLKLFEPVPQEKIEEMKRCLDIAQTIHGLVSAQFNKRSAVGKPGINFVDIDARAIERKVCTQYKLPKFTERRWNAFWESYSYYINERLQAACFVVETAHALSHCLFDVDPPGEG